MIPESLGSVVKNGVAKSSGLDVSHPKDRRAKNGVAVLGCTLWSEATKEAYKGMNDRLKAILSHEELLKTHKIELIEYIKSEFNKMFLNLRDLNIENMIDENCDLIENEILLNYYIRMMLTMREEVEVEEFNKKIKNFLSFSTPSYLLMFLVNTRRQRT